MRLIKSHASLFLPFVILLVPRQTLHIALIQPDAGFAAGHIIYTYCRKNNHGNRNTANNSSRLFAKLGPDTGLDSLNDFCFAPQLAGLLNEMDASNQLPKTVLYYLNPKDADMLAAMAGNFQSNDTGIRGKVQLGSAWWFCDHKYGMEQQMEVLAHTGLLSTFIGMLTDSRSFLSFPRHEYFRRILCEYVGRKVDNGEYPKDMDYLKKMIADICYYNAEKYLNLDKH